MGGSVIHDRRISKLGSTIRSMSSRDEMKLTSCVAVDVSLGSAGWVGCFRGRARTAVFPSTVNTNAFW